MVAKLTIQVVGWNSADVLPKTLTTLSKIPRDAVVIRYIDNASADDSAALVRELLPHADVVELSDNKGFAGAHNVGFARCTTDYVLTHDPDLIIDWPGVKQLVAAFDDPQVGAVQGKLYRTQEKIIDSAGIVHTLALNGRERGAGETDAGQFGKDTPLLAVTGACGLYRVSALLRVAEGDGQVFDEDFFAYKEDVDLGWRLNRAGWRVLYKPVFVGYHRRTLGRRGFIGWGLNPTGVWQRLQSARTRYSLRNWVWMIVKNVTFRQAVVHEIFVDARLAIFFVLSLLYWPLLPVWPEIIRGLPLMLEKRS